MIGRIHSLESFSTVDGPGIRYVVFMQGCKLRCKFCHNPDTWNKNTGTEITSGELLKKILSSRKFLDKSNGGVTISGGEPLLQIDFLIEFCKKLKNNNIHIAIDTAGNFETEDKKINKLFKYVDLVLFDIKHMDNETHKFLTGVENQKILEMANYISNEKKIPMWIRIVYIPTITDKDDTINKYKEFISTLSSIKKVEVLPYHEMGKYKWKELGIKYELENIRIPTKDECNKVSKFIFQK